MRIRKASVPTKGTLSAKKAIALATKGLLDLFQTVVGGVRRYEQVFNIKGIKSFPLEKYYLIVGKKQFLMKYSCPIKAVLRKDIINVLSLMGIKRYDLSEVFTFGIRKYDLALEKQLLIKGKRDIVSVLIALDLL